MERIYIDSRMPFMTNGVYVRRIEEHLIARKKGLMGIIGNALSKKGEPYHSFFFIQDRYNSDITAPFEKRFIVSSFVLQGEVFDLIRRCIKGHRYGDNRKNVRLDGNRLSFRYIARYFDGKEYHEDERDLYECTFYSNSCKVIKTRKDNKLKEEYDYKFIEISPTIEDMYNIKLP